MYNKELQVTSNTKNGISKGNDTTAGSSTRSEHHSKEQTNTSSQRDSQGPGTGSHQFQHVPLSRGRSEPGICCTHGPFKNPTSAESIDTERRKPNCTPTAARPPEGKGWETLFSQL